MSFRWPRDSAQDKIHGLKGTTGTKSPPLQVGAFRVSVCYRDKHDPQVCLHLKSCYPVRSYYPGLSQSTVGESPPGSLWFLKASRGGMPLREGASLTFMRNQLSGN